MRKQLSPAEGRKRRDTYISLRRAGLGAVNAAVAVGVSGTKTAPMYERWFQAIESGQLAQK